MAGEHLHKFDIALCRHVIDVIRSYWTYPGLAQFLGVQLDAEMISCLRPLDDLEADVSKPVLLNDDELADLAELFGGGPLQFDQAWIPHLELCRRSIDCVPDLRSLADEYVREWASVSATCTRQFEKDGLRLHTGIETVQIWVAEIRRFLRAMGRTDLLPCPDGSSPTPTCRTPSHEGRAADATGLQKMRAVIAATEDGRNAKADILIKKARMNRQESRRILRVLETLGEYDGFARQRPQSPS